MLLKVLFFLSPALQIGNTITRPLVIIFCYAAFIILYDHVWGTASNVLVFKSVSTTVGILRAICVYIVYQMATIYSYYPIMDDYVIVQRVYICDDYRVAGNDCYNIWRAKKSQSLNSNKILKWTYIMKYR